MQRAMRKPHTVIAQKMSKFVLEMVRAVVGAVSTAAEPRGV
jgi:hypothetical protein